MPRGQLNHRTEDDTVNIVAHGRGVAFSPPRSVIQAPSRHEWRTICPCPGSFKQIFSKQIFSR